MALKQQRAVLLVLKTAHDLPNEEQIAYRKGGISSRTTNVSDHTRGVSGAFTYLSYKGLANLYWGS